MAQKIQSVSSYFRQLRRNRRDHEAIVKAHAYALDVRKFEIDLYWKRTAYFWGLIAATFAGYFALKSAAASAGLIFLVACIGFLLSLGWYLVNCGSKYWMENWERHVDVLEDKVVGKLYKMNLVTPTWKPHDSYPFSVSKTNQIISLYFVVVWFGLALNSFPWSTDFFRPGTVLKCGAVALVTFGFALYLLFSARHQVGKDRPIDFRVSPLTRGKSR